MPRNEPLAPTGALRTALSRVWTSWRSPVVPDYSPAPSAPAPEQWLWRMDRIRDALEQTRAALSEQGWTSGAWFSVEGAGGTVRTATTAEAFALRDPRLDVEGACLVGTMLRLADDPDTAPSVSDVWGCVDELYEAMHERVGHASFPPGRLYPHSQRRAHLQGLTAWNDAPGRTREQVLDLVDRAIARTLVGSCA